MDAFVENIFAGLTKLGCKCFLDETAAGFRVCIYPPGDPLRKAIISDYKPTATEAYESVISAVLAITPTKVNS